MEFINQHAALFSIASFVGFFIFITAQWIAGKRVAKSDAITDAEKTIDLIQKRADALDIRVDELEEELNEETKKRIALETEKNLIEKLNKQYLEILQNRDPELSKLLVEVSQSLKGMKQSVDELVKSFTTTKVTVSHETK